MQTPTGKTTLTWNVGATVSSERQRATGEVEVRGLARPVGAFKGWYANAGTLEGVAKSAAFNADRSRVIVVAGGPMINGQLWYGDPNKEADGTLIGSLGDGSLDTRQIRCALKICAVSNFRGQVKLVKWDGINAPVIGASIPGTTGAVGIDAIVEGNNVGVRSADFVNNTVTKAVVSSAGDLISSRTKPQPQGCTKPGHVIAWELPGGGAGTLVSCNGTDAMGRSAIAVLSERYIDD